MKKIILILTITFIFAACEDPAPVDIYEPKYVLEALLFVDEPIEGITLIKTQPLNEEFNIDSAQVRDASIIIRSDGREFDLLFRPREDGKIGYYAENSDYIVKPETEYEIEVRTGDGEVITGTTFTPVRNGWVVRAPEMLRYPLDTLDLPEGDSVVWEKSGGFDYYLYSITALDTLGYGEYLDPPTNEKNRRLERPWREEEFYREVSNIRPNPNNKSPIIWNTFRWYGLQEVTVYTPDFNFLRWFIQAQTRGQVEPILTSVKGGIGYFGSTYALRDTFFLVKNQP